MFSENCGFKLRENAAFCPKCGTAVKPEEAEKTKEKEQYTSLVPDFKDIDESKSVSERVSDIEKPLFKDEGDTYVKPKKNIKKIIIIISIMVVLAVTIGVMVFIATRPITLEKAYDSYLAELNSYHDDNDGKIKKITFYDVDNSSIPDMFLLIEYENYDDSYFFYDHKIGTDDKRMEYSYGNNNMMSILYDLSDNTLYSYNYREDDTEERTQISSYIKNEKGFYSAQWLADKRVDKESDSLNYSVNG